MSVELRKLQAHWERVRQGLFETIDKFGEDELKYVPFEGSRTAGSIMLHIADAEDGWFNYAVTRELAEWPKQYRLNNFPTREAIKRALSEVREKTLQYLSSRSGADLEETIEAPWGEKFPLRWILLHVFEHEIHHRGELSLILGMLGREGLEV